MRCLTVSKLLERLVGIFFAAMNAKQRELRPELRKKARLFKVAAQCGNK